MSTPLIKAEIELALEQGAGLPGWSYRADAFEKTYRFPSFKDALGFMVRAGFEAESLNHHPEWSNVYNRVTVRLTTHDAGNKVTAKDLELARRMDAAAGPGV